MYTYSNGRLCLKLENGEEQHELTINLPDSYLRDGDLLLDPQIMKNGIFSAIRHTRIIRKITGMINYNYVDIPIAKVNFGKIREFDSGGMARHIDKIRIDIFEGCEHED